jgi:hypothetical protein
MDQILAWLVNNVAYVVLVVSLGGGALMGILAIVKAVREGRRASTENKKLKLEVAKLEVDLASAQEERRLARHDLDVRALAEYICVYAANAKRRAGKSNLVFQTESFRCPIDPEGQLFHAAIGLLITQGRAKADIPDYWTID